MIMLTVTTCPRETSYLVPTLKSLDENGANLCDEKWVVTDGMTCVEGGGAERWNMRINGQKTGNRLAMWRAFQLAVDREADWLIYCEDDIVCSKDAIAKIVDIANAPAWSRDDIAFETYFDARMVPEGAEPGWKFFHHFIEAKNEWFCGALCMLIPRRTLDYLVKCDPLNAPYFMESFHAGDCVMAYHLSKSPWPYYGVHVPCLIDHRGDVSSIPKGYPVMPVRTRNFAGERDATWKALQKGFHSR